MTSLDELGMPPSSVSEDYVPGMHRFQVADQTKMYLVHRFTFTATDAQEFVGNLLFEAGAYEAARNNGQMMDIQFDEAALGAEDVHIVEALTSFMLHLPTPVAIKEPTGDLLWGNRAYLQMSRSRTVAQIRGKQTGDLFQLDHNEVQNHENIAKTSKVGILASELVRSIERRVLRFPILDSDRNVIYLGAVGTGTADSRLAPKVAQWPEETLDIGEDPETAR